MTETTTCPPRRYCLQRPPGVMLSSRQHQCCRPQHQCCLPQRECYLQPRPLPPTLQIHQIPLPLDRLINIQRRCKQDFSCRAASVCQMYTDFICGITSKCALPVNAHFTFQRIPLRRCGGGIWSRDKSLCSSSLAFFVVCLAQMVNHRIL